MAESDYHGDSDGEGEAPGMSDAAGVQWAHDRELIRGVLGEERGALEQLYTEKLWPIVEANQGHCPVALVERFYRESCRALRELINKSRPPEHELWSSRVSNLGEKLATKLRSAEWDWLRITLVLRGRVDAADALLTKYDSRILRLAQRFKDKYPEIVDDLAQEGRMMFRDEVILRYNPNRGTTLWEYAAVVLRRRMHATCIKWAKPRVPEPLYRRVTAAIDKLREKHPQREPTPEEIARECGDSIEDVRQVMQSGSLRRVTSFDKNWYDEEAPPLAAVDWAADPEDVAVRRAQFEALVEYLNERGGTGPGEQDGVRWLVLFVLKESEGFTWEEMVALLQGHMALDWPNIHETYALPYSVPTDLTPIRQLFGPGQVKLTVDNLKRWYVRRTTSLRRWLKPRLGRRRPE
jgi:DNA-directed RNA polymerase specialized sigma subunit